MKISRTRITIESYKETMVRIDTDSKAQTIELPSFERSVGHSGLDHEDHSVVGGTILSASEHTFDADAGKRFLEEKKK